MTQAAALILGISLIVAGIGLLGDALGQWKVPGDFWAVVIVLLGAAGRYASQAIGKGAVSGEPPDDDSNPPPIASPPSNGSKSTIAILFILMFAGCGSVESARAGEAWARCAGGGAIECIPAAQGEPAQAAIQYASCLASKAIGCTAPLVASSNPPQDASTVEKCAKAVAEQCHQHAAIERPPNATYSSHLCVERLISRCWRHP